MASPGKPASSRARVGIFRILVSAAILFVVMGVWFLFAGGKLRAEEVISESMEPTIKVGDRLIVTSDVTDPIQRGDIVVVASQDEDPFPLIKRVAAVPGDEVVVANEHVFVNRMPTAKEVVDLKLVPLSMAYRVKIPPDHYFVLGDNRQNSFDSVVFGPVKRADIIGRPIYRYAPWARRGSLKDE